MAMPGVLSYIKSIRLTMASLWWTTLALKTNNDNKVVYQARRHNI